MVNKIIDQLIQQTDYILNDQTVPKNIKVKINDLKTMILDNKEEEISLIASKALSILEDILEQPIEPFIRTQIWNLVSLLEPLIN